jgi:hypothetical protein
LVKSFMSSKVFSCVLPLPLDRVGLFSINVAVQAFATGLLRV